ncbi:hypothetical protein J7L18_06065 [Candidatus Bathyarchaeota archaeon]|nr:hypothetical protein [Candidatus Bathyarchaeota archaeon]
MCKPQNLHWDKPEGNSQEVVEHGGHSGTLKIYRDEEVREIRPTVDSYLEDRTFIRAVATRDGSEIRSPYSDAVKTLGVTIAANKAAEKATVAAIQ